MVHVSQRTADYIRRHRLSYILSTRFDGMSCRKYIKCCVVISVMVCTALWANPFAVSKGQGIVFATADVAEFGAGIESIDYSQFFPVPGTFVAEHLSERIETYFRDSAAEFPVSDHVADSKVFDRDNIIISDQPCCEFIQVILPGISNGFVKLCHLEPLPGIPGASFLSSGENALLSFQDFHLRRQEARVLYNLPSGESSKAFYPEIDTHRLSGFRQGQNIFIEAESNKVFPGRILGYRNRTGGTLEVSAPSDFQLSESGDCEVFINSIILESRSGIFSGLFVSFLFELGILPGFTEEVIISRLEMSESLLGRDTGDFVQPYGFSITLPACKHGAGLIIRDRFPLAGPCVRFNTESTVIYIPAASEDFFEMVCLISRRVKPVCISELHGLVDGFFEYNVNHYSGGKAVSSAS